MSNAMSSTELGSMDVQGENENGNSLKAEEIRPHSSSSASPSTANDIESEEKFDLTGAAVPDPTTAGAIDAAAAGSVVDGASEKVEDIGKVRGLRDSRLDASLLQINQEISKFIHVL